MKITKRKIGQLLMSGLMIASALTSGFALLSAYDFKAVKAYEENTCCSGSYECYGENMKCKESSCSSTTTKSCQYVPPGSD